MDEQHAEGQPDGDAEELLRRALLDPEAAAAVALRVHGLALAEHLTVVFHGRRDLGTIQTYVANGGHGGGGPPRAGDPPRGPGGPRPAPARPPPGGPPGPRRPAPG